MRTAIIGLGLLMLPAGRPLAQALPGWAFTPTAQDSLAIVWSLSATARREEVACLGGTIGPDTVRIERALPLVHAQADSLTADAGNSLETCSPPDWIGTAHTHVRSTDDPSPAPHFSPADRIVMSLWSNRWGRAGAFCVLYSSKAAHCEVYPPR